MVTQKDFYAKETLMQFLHLDHILSNYYGTQEQYEDVIKAKVVLPKELFKAKGKESSNTVVPRAEGKMSGSVPFNKSNLKFAEATINLKRTRDLVITLKEFEKTIKKSMSQHIV